ncbi:MAG: GatB/YqeY domain-containing protein [Candidatus Pacebacteria bacterium]|nr:GatB/YqeY domain-containing protein [Candidatus Paceibacterota bacterium]MDD3919195.1 GatB/YqeY domain-containing protein [Candidatus Paceibacterota bacterium]
MIVEQIKKDLISFQKEKRSTEVSSLRMLLSSIVNREKDKRLKLSQDFSEEELILKSQLTEEEVLEVISSEAKKRKDAIEEYKKANRVDLIENESLELKTLQKYLPPEMGEEEIRNIVKQVIEEQKITDMKGIGILMKEVIQKTKGMADGKKINNIAKELLS